MDTSTSQVLHRCHRKQKRQIKILQGSEYQEVCCESLLEMAAGNKVGTMAVSVDMLTQKGV